ncbi:MAG: siroheme synthase [Desulfovibrionaceae bacterium CG1_02_65_16]|nr:MAG: siroheme synthase [Desulfovibrionaceae bacterium CG1_02_65_16]
MRYYPIFVDLAARSCLVVGAGQVGLRKIRSLAECAPQRLLIIEPGEPDPALLELAKLPGVRLERRAFAEADLDGVFLAIAATSRPEVNRRIAGLCRQRCILCNVIDLPDEGSFIAPACVRRGDLTIAVSTGGDSPALTKRIRKDLQDRFGEEYARFLLLMSRLRPRVLALGWETEANSELFRALAGSGLLAALRRGDADFARTELIALLPPELHHLIAELLDGLA